GGLRTPDQGLHTQTVPFQLADASRSPSGDQRTLGICPDASEPTKRWAACAAARSPVSACRTRIPPRLDPIAMCAPSGDHATPKPSRSLGGCSPTAPLAASRPYSPWLHVAAARRRPSGDHDTSHATHASVVRLTTLPSAVRRTHTAPSSPADASRVPSFDVA